MELCYQPVVQSKMSMVTGVEALIRWTHPERGPISPALFIPIAEEANMIWQLGGWVLRKACEDASRWPGDMRVAVNVSPIPFANPDLPIGRASCRERVCQYVSISVVAVSLNKNQNIKVFSDERVIQ